MSPCVTRPPRCRRAMACRGLAELERSARVVVLMHVHAVEHERVEVDVEPEGAVRALYGHHRARVGDRHAAEAELTLRSPAQRAVHLSHERAHDLGAELAVVAEQGAQAPRQRADPVTDGHARQDALLQVDGGVRHPTTEARGAESPLLAAQRHQLGVPAFAANQMQTAPLQPPAAKVLLELLHHEARQAAVLFGALEELRPVRFDRLIEHGALRPVTETRPLGLGEGVRGVAHVTGASASGVPAG